MLTNLTQLNVGGNRIGSDGIVSLSPLTNLKRLIARDYNMFHDDEEESAALSHLTTALPDTAMMVPAMSYKDWEYDLCNHYE